MVTRVLVICVCFFSFLRLGAGSQPSVLRAGFAEQDITPPVGSERPGGYGKSYHRSIHDPCKVRAGVFEAGSQRVAIVGVDALALHRQFVLEARRRISKQCPIPEGSIMISASHSHSSGPVFGVLPGQYDFAPPEVRKLAYKFSTCVDPKYYKKVLEGVVSAVHRAYESLEPVTCCAGVGKEKGVSFNRRFLMKNGLTYTHPGRGNPDIVKVAGPIDPDVGVLGAWSSKGALRGCIVTFACHATTSPGGISANYIYYLERVVRGFFGPNVVVVFLPGACGDVTQVNNLSPYAYPSGERWAQIVGGRVGAEALKVLLSAPRGTLLPLAARSRVLKINRRRPSSKRVEEAWRIVRSDPSKVGHTAWTFAKETILLRWLLERSPAAEVEVQAIQVGPVIFVSNPAEFFCELGLRIKRASPFPFTFPVTLANGCVGYVPTREAFGPHGGGYETRLTSYSNLDISAGDLIVDTSVELAKQLKPGAVPQPPPAPPFRGPWSYGNVPPQVH